MGAIDEHDYRAGTFAVFQGRTYTAGSQPNIRSEITLLPEDGREQRVGIDELEGWYRTSWTFLWQGQPFSVLTVLEGKIKGHYKGGSHLFAWDVLHREIGPDGKHEIYTITLAPEFVEHLTEHREDLLARWKEEQLP
jgi:hypothetical protein